MVQWEYCSKFIHPSWQDKIITLIVCLYSSPMDTLRIEYSGISLNSLLSQPWHGLCSVLLCFEDRQPNALGRGKQECCRDSLEACTCAKPLKCKGASRFLRTLSLIPVTAIISSVRPVSRLYDMQETLDRGSGELRTLLFLALNHSSSPLRSELHEKCECIFSHLKYWLFRLLIPSHIEINIIARLQHPLKPLPIWQVTIQKVIACMSTCLPT